MLSGDVDIPNAAKSSNWTITIANNLDSQFSDISSVDVVGGKTIVTFTKDYRDRIKQTSSYSTATLTGYVSSGKNALYCPNHLEVGNIVFDSFKANHAEGGSTHAIA